jgi:hypothetical protein|nr:MAG TPA: NUMOD1 domain protein [Caudoviricetes sp.]
MKKLYMAVTPDELELPLFVTENIDELAKKFNTTTGTIWSCISHKSSGRNAGARYIRIILEDE